MALHPDFPADPHAVLDPAIRWFPADEALRKTSFEKLRKEVRAWRDSGYDGAAETSKSLLRYLVPKANGTTEEFRHYINQAQTDVRYGFDFVDDEGYQKYPPRSFAELVQSFREFQS